MKKLPHILLIEVFSFLCSYLECVFNFEYIRLVSISWFSYLIRLQLCWLFRFMKVKQVSCAPHHHLLLQLCRGIISSSSSRIDSFPGSRCCSSKQHHFMDTLPTHIKQQPTLKLIPFNKNSDTSAVPAPAEEENCFLPILPVAFLTINSIIALFRAYDHKDIWMIIFVLFLYFGFMSLFVCLRAFDRLPQHEQSRKKEWLKVAIWVLTTSLNLGLAIKFAPLIYPVARVFILAMAISTSVCGFYFFFIYKDDNSDQKKIKTSSQPKLLEQSPLADHVKIKSHEPPLPSDPLNIV